LTTYLKGYQALRAFRRTCKSSRSSAVCASGSCANRQHSPAPSQLAALVPRPHKNLTVYGGVLAPNAKLRSQVVAYGSVRDPQPSGTNTQPPATSHGSHDANFAEPAPTAKPLRPNYTWAELMRRTFAIDVLACQYCGGRLKLLAAVMNPKAVRAILASLHWPAEAPESRPARAPPEPFETA
jgi:hypothetical protein